MSWKKIHNLVEGQADQFNLLLKKTKNTQKNFLKNLIIENKYSEFGRRYNFKTIVTIEDYQKRVPVLEYSNLDGDIKRMRHGEQNILCSEPVISFERTGGSSSGDKYIPYTSASLKSFHTALYPWLDDLLQNRPGIKKGRLYWSISPSLNDTSTYSTQDEDTLDNDANYFGLSLAQEFSKLIIIPQSLSHLKNYNEWRYFTLRYLLAADDLSFISVWSPTFLLDLMSHLLENHKQLSSDIKHGVISIVSDKHHQHPSLTIRDPQRAETILQACSGNVINGTLLWPILDTISCWQDATSKQFIPKLKGIFNGAHLQAKGLLATEGIFSTPLSEHDASVLTVDSGFYEFIDTDENIHLAHELVVDKSYEVIISNFSGLYRYRTGDCVRVTGFSGCAPLIEFIGRAGISSDLCGEKLTDTFVQQQFNDVKGFMMLMPQISKTRTYRLILEASQYDKNEANEIATTIDDRLKDNPQYAYARNIQQLSPLKALRCKNAWKKYIKYEIDRGRKIGDIKACSLYTDADFLKMILADL